MYNNQVTIAEEFSDNGRILIIRPTMHFKLSRLGKDAEALNAQHDFGVGNIKFVIHEQRITVWRMRISAAVVNAVVYKKGSVKHIVDGNNKAFSNKLRTDSNDYFEMFFQNPNS